ncbi:hypothetical protein LGV61_09380 [Desulfurispirillum indicum]|uniref:hypothetical protein n=1 Tax=Desulfurispirillum indicum TaxID=936456 RepID=UPI001CFB72CC|nr:hypothetical protein [Desulfurispirillum indicum]UCZ55932.1 hypothetical protein LGV61_09380 [Desulfurispirillum indicum]
MLTRLKTKGSSGDESHRKDYVFEGIQKALSLNSEDKYAYLALGQLLRERGELEQAIKIHKTLQISADQDIFMRSLLELAKDYKAAGLHDRAKESLKEFLSLKDSIEGYALLIEVCIQLVEYEAVVDAYKKLSRLTGENYQYEISLFLYLLYEQTEDQSFLKSSHKQYQRNFFSNLAFAREHRDRPEKGLPYLDVALEAPHAVGSMIYPFMESAYQDYLGKDGIRQRYQKRLDTFGFEVSTVQHFSHYLYISGYKQDAFDLLEEVIARGETSVHIFHMLAMLHYQEGNTEEASRVFIHRYPLNQESFRCSHCGFVSRKYQLLCPGCSSIGTMDEQFSHFTLAALTQSLQEKTFLKLFPLKRREDST